MSVAEMLEDDAQAQSEHARELSERIVRNEAALGLLREQLATAELQTVEMRVAANILRKANLRVERRAAGFHVEIDPTFAALDSEPLP